MISKASRKYSVKFKAVTIMIAEGSDGIRQGSSFNPLFLVFISKVSLHTGTSELGFYYL
jgi:hypothetical protein